MMVNRLFIKLGRMQYAETAFADDLLATVEANKQTAGVNLRDWVKM